jgi:malate dehydrogenase
MKAAGAAIGADALVGVVGVTNAMVASSAGKGSVTAITRPAQAAAESAIASATGADPASVKQVIAWGTGVADTSHAMVGGKWFKGEVPASEPSTAVAADAIVAHMKDWALGSDGKWVSMGVPAVGDYGMGSGFFYSVPVVCTPGEFKRVGGVTLTPAVAEVMEKDRLALLAEKTAAGL